LLGPPSYFSLATGLHQRGSLEIPRGRGISKAKISKGKYQSKLELPEGWGAQTKKNLRGGSMDIF